MFPLAKLSQWNPIRLDALGLVTMFGAKEMISSVGNLTQSWVTEWLPILGSYAVANNEIVEPEPGFVLYNIKDGIMATDVSSWFTRWLTSYPITYSATTIHLERAVNPGSKLHGICAMIVGCCTCGLLLVFTILTADWWGVANVIALFINVLVRRSMVSMLRASVDRAIENLADEPGPDVKAFLTLPNGNAVTIRGPRGMVTDILLTNPRPLQPTVYFYLRVAGWAAFGIHALTLGMSALLNQALSVLVLLTGTYLTATKVGDRREFIGKRLELIVKAGDVKWSRSPAYARLELLKTEEDSMVQWGLMPHRSNTFWWERYRAKYPTSSSKDCQ